MYWPTPYDEVLSMKPELVDSFDPVSEADVAGFERDLEIKLPQDYREFLVRTNGGCFRDEVHDGHLAGVESLFGLPQLVLRNYFSDLRRMPYFDDDNTLLRVGSNGLGDQLLLKIRGAEFGCVWIYKRDFPTLNDDEEPLYHVADSFSEFLAKLQLDPDRDMSEESKTLFRAIEDGNEAMFFELFRTQDIESLSDDNWPILSFTVFHHRLRIAKHLLDAGADIERRDRGDETPIFFAVKGHCLDALKLLIERGANINAVNAEGKSLLMLAAGIDNMRGALHLLESGADVHYRSPQGQYALDACNPGSYAYDFVRPVLKARMRLQ